MTDDESDVMMKMMNSQVWNGAKVKETDLREAGEMNSEKSQWALGECRPSSRLSSVKQSEKYAACNHASVYSWRLTCTAYGHAKITQNLA